MSVYTKKFIFGFIVGLFIANASYAGFSSTTSEFTSSTSGSVKKIFTQNEKERLNQFVVQNYYQLQEAAAKGSGTVLNDYVNLMGCKNSSEMMTKAIQRNYTHLFNNGSNQVVHRTEEMIVGDSQLALACGTRS